MLVEELDEERRVALDVGGLGGHVRYAQQVEELRNILLCGGDGGRLGLRLRRGCGRQEGQREKREWEGAHEDVSYPMKRGIIEF